MTDNNKFIPRVSEQYIVAESNQPVKKSPLSTAARSKIINRSGSNYISDRYTIINPSYGPAAEVIITSSSEIVFISSQKYGESSWERTEEPGNNHGSTGVIEQGSEWQTRKLSAGIFSLDDKTAKLLLQKLESGEIKVEKKAEFKCDFSTSDYGSSFYCIPHHETAESRRLKEETIKAFRENVETREENWQKLLRNAPFGVIFPMLGEVESEKVHGIKKI